MKRTLKDKQLQLMAQEVLQVKNVIRKWYNFVGIKYLQEHQLTDEQEELLCDITDYVTNSIDRLEDEGFLKNPVLPPIQLPQKKAKA